MTVIFCILDGEELLPYFARYYRSQGATRFIGTVYQHTDKKHWQKIISMMKELGMEYATDELTEGQRTFPSHTNNLNRMRKILPADSWYCVADLDEFHNVDAGGTLDEACREAEKEGWVAIAGHLLDRVSVDGTFPEIDGGNLDDLFPNACDLTLIANPSHIILPKVACARADVEIMHGHHCCVPSQKQITTTHHFKWGGGIIERLKFRATFTEPGVSNGYGEQLELLGSSKIDLGDPRLNVRPAKKIGI